MIQNSPAPCAESPVPLNEVTCILPQNMVPVCRLRRKSRLAQLPTVAAIYFAPPPVQAVTQVLYANPAHGSGQGGQASYNMVQHVVHLPETTKLLPNGQITTLRARDYTTLVPKQIGTTGEVSLLTDKFLNLAESSPNCRSAYYLTQTVTALAMLLKRTF